MKIAVLGAGAMGSMLGAYLQLGGADVTLLVRRKELAFEEYAFPAVRRRSLPFAPPCHLGRAKG